jgi:hypothetical protein
MEQWKDIKGFEGLYEVSNLGNVRSLDRMVLHKNNYMQFKPGKLIKPQYNHAGYLRFDLLGKKCRAHRLVAAAFIPNKYNKEEVNHINGIRDDNRLENLEWTTKSENNIHKYARCK